jgi:hypothetical protein
MTPSATSPIASGQTGTLVIRSAATTINSGIPVGGTVTIYNSGSSAIQLSPGAGVTLLLAGTPSTASIDGIRTLQPRALATVVSVATDTYAVIGAGVG